MKWQRTLSVLLYSTLLGRAVGYGTTVSIAVNYCPAIYTSSGTVGASTTSASPTPSSGPVTPFYLSFLVNSVLPRRIDGRAIQTRRYIAADGSVTEDPRAATSFVITPSGQLMNSGGYISTSGDVDAELFRVLPELKLISTRFSVRQNDTLAWENTSFAGGEAIFCLLSNLFVVFDGTLPTGCAMTDLNVIPIDEVVMPPLSTSTTNSIPTQPTTSLTYVTSATTTTPSVPTFPPGTVYGNVANAIPLGCLSSGPSSPALLGPNTSVSHLEQCADYCFEFKFFGVQSGSFCVCGNAFQNDAQGTCDIPCAGNEATICGGQDAISAYEIVFVHVGPGSTSSSPGGSTTHQTNPTSSPMVVTTSASGQQTISTTFSDEIPPSTTSSATTSDFPAPTSSGTPNCFDGSEFDGTVNSDYLILCDTDLPGSDLDSVPSADIAECIEACNSYVPSGAGVCIAVEFDILAEANPCRLKFNIGVVTRGGNPFSQAAIVVNSPLSPEIMFSGDPGFSTTTSPYVEPTTTTMSTTTDPPIFTTTPTPSFTSMSLISTSTIGNTPAASSTVSPTPSQSQATTSTGAPSTGVPSSGIQSTGALSTTGVPSSGIPSTGAPSTGVSSSGIPSTGVPSTGAPSTTIASTGAPTSPIPSTSNGPSTQLVNSSTTTTQQPPAPSTSSNPVSTIVASSSTAGTPQSSSSPGVSSTLPVPGTSSSSGGSPSTSLSVSGSSSATTLSTTSATSRISTTTILPVTSGTTTFSPITLGTSSIITSSASSTSGPSTLSTSSRSSGTTLSTLSTAVATTTTTRTTASPYCSGATPTAALCPAYNHQAVNVNADGACYEIECQTTLDGNILTANSTRTLSHNACIGVCSLYNIALPFTCVGVNWLGSAVPGNNCLLLSDITGTRYLAGVDSGRLLYGGYPLINDPNYGTISVSSVSQTAAPTQTSAISTTTLNCPAGPTSISSPLCPGNSPFCNSYNSWGTPNNFEIECATSFTGPTLQALLAFSLADCISWCQYANTYSTSLCAGVTFREGNTTQGGANNCFRYTSLTCATRGNATFNSARILNANYPDMTDYNDPNFLCGAQTSSTIAAGSSSASVSTSRAVTSGNAPATTTTNPALAVTTTRAATSTVTDLSQATSNAFPSAYPQDPVCENNLISKFEGGQALVNPVQGRYYDIECAADYNTVTNLPFRVTNQPTYNSCLNSCDAAVAANASQSCAAFSWVSSTGACTLLAQVTNGRQTTTGMANTLGTHSGRYLYNNPGYPDGPGLQLYLSKPIPFPTGQNVQGATLPAYPGGTNTYFNGWAANAHTTPLDLSSLGIQWRIFGQTSNKLFVSANFWLTTTQLELNSSTQTTWSQGGRNNDASPIPFPAANLPAYTISPFWTQGFILAAGQQGIYYQVDVIAPGQYGISIEWYFSHFQIDNAVQHAMMTYDTAVPGVWTTYFFRAGSTTADQGRRQTVGGQGSPSIVGQSFNFCQGGADCITPGSKLAIDTRVQDYSTAATYNASYFNPAGVAFGSWTWSNRPV